LNLFVDIVVHLWQNNSSDISRLVYQRQGPLNYISTSIIVCQAIDVNIDITESCLRIYRKPSQLLVVWIRD